jgi:hypothetical protein
VETKICGRCKIEKLVECFSKCKNHKSGYDWQCKDCHRQWRKENKEYIDLKRKEWALAHPKKVKRAQRNWTKRNRDKILKRNREIRAEHPERARNHHLKFAFGITLDDYNKMFQTQNGLCAICGQPETKIDKQKNKLRVLSVDHNHTTGQIRSLLCDRCNLGIAFFKDNAEILSSASNYLNKWNVLPNTETGK